MPLLVITLAILLLILLIAVCKTDPFLSFLVVSLATGLAMGLEPSEIVRTFEKGIANTLGSLIMILSLGAMLGKLVADMGAASRIAGGLVSRFGIKNIQWAMMLTGFIVGIPMFYNIGFVILVPLVFTVASATRLPLLYVGIPLLASLSVTHGFLPPHPSPSAIATIFGAHVGKTLLYGLLLSIPIIVVAGPFFSRFLMKVPAAPLKGFENGGSLNSDKLPGLAISILSALLPVFLILFSLVLQLLPAQPEHIGFIIVRFIGEPAIALLVSVFFAIAALGLLRGMKMTVLMGSISASVNSIAMLILIIAGSGIFKEVLSETGIGTFIGNLFRHSDFSPLLLGWLVAAVIRVSIGSATVAGLTAAGILAPLVSGTGVNAELMVLSIGAGSLMLSHVNDSGFWLYKEYFSLSIRDTLLSWTIMETIVSLMGLAGVLLLNLFI